MCQFLQVLLSSLVGTLVGCILTWLLMTRTARNQARRETLITAAKALQDYRVDYAQWYVEYMSPIAQAPGGWAKPTTGKPDPIYLELMSAVDKGRGRLRVIIASLYAHFPQKVVKPICVELMRVLKMSAHDAQADCREVDVVAEGAFSLIPDLIKRYH
ncbi:MAG: hypothetical protein ABSF26_26100 [Thermoguttaceae bacterium]|jgi:hypothetical protein